MAKYFRSSLYIFFFFSIFCSRLTLCFEPLILGRCLISLFGMGVVAYDYFYSSNQECPHEKEAEILEKENKSLRETLLYQEQKESNLKKRIRISTKRKNFLC